MSSTHQQVVDRLKAVGASLFAPLVGADDIDFAVRNDDGQYVELRVLESREGERVFTVGRFRPKPYIFFLCVSAEETWVIPSNIFERFSAGGSGGPSLTLSLDQDDLGETLGDRLRIYRDRWVLIAEFRKYRSTLSDPVALQMMLAMG